MTPQAVVMASKPRICITHAPGHMLVLDTKNEELSLRSSIEKCTVDIGDFKSHIGASLRL